MSECVSVWCLCVEFEGGITSYSSYCVLCDEL